MADESRTVRRAYTVYVYAVSFVAVLVLLFTISSVLFSIVRIAFPDTTAHSGFPFGGFPIFGGLSGGFAGDDAERDAGVVQLVQNGLLALVAGGVLFVHRRWGNELRAEEAKPARKPPRARSRTSQRSPARTPKS